MYCFCFFLCLLMAILLRSVRREWKVIQEGEKDFLCKLGVVGEGMEPFFSV